MVLEVEKFRLHPDNMVQVKPKKSPRSKKGYFIRGPIPIGWLAIAGNLPGKSLHVGLALWFAYGIEKQTRFKFTPTWRGWFNISPVTLRASLRRLKDAGLIRLEHRPGCSPIVTILEVPDDSAQ